MNPLLQKPDMKDAILQAQKLLDETDPQAVGTTTTIGGYAVETHTLGCRREADTPEADWWDQHWAIFDDYNTDGMSTVIGDPADGKFVTLTPTRKTAAVKTAKQIGPVYHGTPHVFDEFAPTTGQRTLLGLIPLTVKSNAFFFTPDITTARNWAGNRAEKGDSQYVLECTITLNNPIDFRTDDWVWDDVDVQPLPMEGTPNPARTHTLLEALREYTEDTMSEAEWLDCGVDINKLEVPNPSAMWKLIDSKPVMDVLRFLKYDGAIVDEGNDPELGGISYAVFNKNQIKIVKRTKIAAKPVRVTPLKNIRYAPLEYEDIGSKNMVRDEYLPPLEYEDIGKYAPKKEPSKAITIRGAFSSVREINISEDQGSAEGYTADTNAEQLQNWLDRFGYTNEEFVADLRKKYDSFAVLNNINVYEDARGKGYGDYLLQEFLREAGDRGAGICLLVADTAEEQAKGFNLIEWYERNDFEQVASVYGGELMILGILNPKIAAKKAAADIGQMKNIVAEMMGVLTAGLPQPEVKIINQTNNTLGQCRWLWGKKGGETWGDDNTTLEIQKKVLGHEETLRRVIAHELCHHEVALLVAKPKLLELGYDTYKRYGNIFGPDGHGKEWKEVAKRFDAKYGADFVTEKSDKDTVVDEQGKEIFVLLNNYVYGRHKQRLGWQWAVGLSRQAMAYLDGIDWASGEFKLVKTTDSVFTKGRGRIKQYTGWNLPRTPEQEQKLQDLWANAPMAKFGADEEKIAKGGPHKNATSQINLPPDAAAGMMEAAKRIPDEELGKDGREDDPHITIKYGVKPDPDLLSRIVGEQQPFTVTLGKTHVFSVSESSDAQAPIVVQCHAPELADLHNRVAEAMGTRPDDFSYVPHVTLAYVKPDVAAKYEGMDWAEGISFQVDSITLSTKGGGRVHVPFGKPRKTAADKEADWDSEEGQSFVEKLKALGVETEIVGSVAKKGRGRDLDLLVKTPISKEELIAKVESLGAEDGAGIEFYSETIVSPEEAAKAEKTFHKGWSTVLSFNAGIEDTFELWLTDEFEKTSSHKTPPMSDTQYRNPEMGEETNAYADIPERVEGVEDLPSLEELSPSLFKTGAGSVYDLDLQDVVAWGGSLSEAQGEWDKIEAECIERVKAEGRDWNKLTEPEQEAWKDKVGWEWLGATWEVTMNRLQSLKFPLVVYRGLGSVSLKEINTGRYKEKGTGIYWSYDENNAYVHEELAAGHPHIIMLRGIASSPKQIDWIRTAYVNLVASDEKEINIWPGEEVQITGYKYKGDKAWKTPPKNLRTVRAAAANFKPMLFDNWCDANPMYQPDDFNEAEYRYDENVAHFSTVDFPITIYRAVEVEAGTQVDFNNAGVYWSWVENSAQAYFGEGSIWGPGGKKIKEPKIVMLKAQVLHPTDVDWDATLLANMLNEEENEITIKAGSSLRLLGVDYEGKGYQKPAQKMVTAFGDDSKNLPMRGQKGIGGQDFPVMTEPPLFSDEKEAAAKPKYLYHGTEKKNLDDILKNGLRVEFNESNIEWQKATYLACDTYTAANYAGHKGAKSEDWAVLQIEISKLREDLLRPDDYDFPDMWGRESMHEEVNVEVGELKEEYGPNWAEVPWEVSLQVCCQIAYLGDIPPDAIKVIPSPKFGSLKTADAESYFTGLDEAARSIITEFEQHIKNPKYRQKWEVVPAARLKKIWNDYAKTGMVRDEKGMGDIAWTVQYNIWKIHANTILCGHSEQSPIQFAENVMGENLEEKYGRDVFQDDNSFFDDDKGAWRLSDYALDPLVNAAAKLENAKTAEQQLQAVDFILNIVHARSDLASWFVQGGTSTLNSLAGYKKASGSTQLLPDEVEMVADVAHGLGGKSFPKLEKEPLFPEDKEKTAKIAKQYGPVYHGTYREWSDKIQIDQYKIGKFFSSDPLVAQAYGTFVHECYLTMNKPFIVDAKGSGYSSIPTPKKLKGWVAEGMDEVDTDIIAKYAYENGYDGAIIKNVYELHHQSLADDYIVFKPAQVKRKGIIEPEIDPYTANKYHKQELMRRQKRDWEAKYGPEEATTASVKTAASFQSFNAWLKKMGGIGKLLSEYDVDEAETYGYGLEDPSNPAEVKSYQNILRKRAVGDFRERYENLVAEYQNWQFPMDVFRCISLPKAEEAQQQHLFPDTPQAKFQQGLQAIKYNGVGIYWSWDEDSAECHWGNGGPNVTLHAVINKENVDWEGTIYANMFPALGDEEKEVRLLEGTQFELEGIQYDEKSGWSQPPVKTVTASVMGQVYLLHFDIDPKEEVPSTRDDAKKPFHARHYMGWAENAQERIDQHYKATSGVKLIEAIHAKGISFTVARIWDNVDRDFERRMKNQGGLNRHCPICKKLGLIPASRYRGKALEKQVAPETPEAGPDFVEIDKNAAASDLANLRSYLTLNKREMGEELARSFSSYWQEFVENEHPEFADKIDEDGYTEDFDAVPENVFSDFLDEYGSRAMQDDPAMAPTFLTVDYRRDVKNAWLVHFTDYPEAIAKDGFRYGMDRVEQLALTTYFKDEAKKFGGYNFALDAHHRNLEGLGKNYGKHCVLFQANGIETYHSGDDFEQIIFWGKDAKNIIPIMHWNDELWHIGENADGDSLFSSYNVSDCVEYGIAHAATLVPKKVRKPKAQRAVASETVTLYHRTRPGREEQINSQGLSHIEGGGELWFTDDPLAYYGGSPNAVYSIEVPKAEANGAHVGGHDYRFMGRSFGPDQIKKVAAEPWEMRQDEYAGRWNEQETEEESGVRHQKNQDWEQNSLAALSLGKITPEQAKERGVYEAKSFIPLPTTPLYHVTTAKSQVEANGLKTRRELGQNYGKGLGGGTSMSISFTDDISIARGIYDNLLIARKVAAGEMTLDDLISTATKGMGAKRPWIDDILKSLGGSNPKDKINVELDAIQRGVAFEHGLGRPPDDEAILPQYRKPGPWRPTPWSQHWKGGDGEEKYTYWERDLTSEEKQERVFEFFKKWSFWREQAGGGLDPLYFMSDPKALGQTPESEIAILTFKAVPGAMGTRESALGEWRVYTGAAVQLVGNAAAAKAGAFNPNRANVQYKSEKGTGEWEGWNIDFSVDPVKEHMLPASFVRKLKGIEQKFISIDDVVETQGSQWTTEKRVDEIHTQMEAEKWFEAVLVDEYEDQQGKYYLEEGHHRTRAAKRMGKKTVPAVIMKLEPRKPHWSLSSGIVKKTADIAKFAFFIEVPKASRGHFWDEPPAHNLEFWAFKGRPAVLPNEKVYFTFDRMPVAETICLKVEKPGESICELTGKYEKHWKLYWEPAKFVKYASTRVPVVKTAAPTHESLLAEHDVILHNPSRQRTGQPHVDEAVVERQQKTMANLLYHCKEYLRKSNRKDRKYLGEMLGDAENHLREAEDLYATYQNTFSELGVQNDYTLSLAINEQESALILMHRFINENAPSPSEKRSSWRESYPEKWVYHPDFGAFSRKGKVGPHADLVEKTMGEGMASGRKFDEVERGYANIDPAEKTITIETFDCEACLYKFIPNDVVSLYQKKFPGYQILIPQESKAIGVTAAMPKKWYHGTSKKNAEIILQDGYLRPDQETTYDIDIPRDGAVYIAEFDIANQYAIERGGPVLEVAAPDISKLLPDEDDVYELLNDRGGELNAKGSAQAKRVKALWLKQWNEENASYNDPDKFPIYKNFEDAWAAWGGIEFEGSSELAEQMKYLTDYIVKNDPKLARAIIELSGKAAHMGPLKVVRQVKTAAPKSIWYHGTSIKNLRSIMSQGLVPEGTEKVWADDPDAGISAPSRQSYGGCYDDLTRILTRYRGFQYFYDLLPDDEVATLVNGRELVYEKPSAFTRYWHEGLMYAFKTRLIDQMITPDHRAYWRNRISNVNRVNSGQPELNFQLSRVDSLIGSKEVKSCGLGRTKEYIQNSWRHVEFKRDAEWHCASAPQLFEVPLAPQWAIPVKERRNKFAERPEQFQFDDWLEFLGWYLSEGSLGDKSQIAISQQKLENRAEIKFLLSRMRIPFYTDKQGIRFSHHGLFEYLKQFGLAQDKFIPQEIKELAPDKLKIILSSLMKGDGSWKSKPKRKGGESGIYSSVSRRLRDDVAEIALKCGYGVSLGVGKPTIGRFKGNFPIYRVYLSKWNSTSLCGNPSIIEFKGWVSCVQVPSGVIFVERNGKTCWSGNSYVTQNLMTATGAPDTEDKKARGGSLVVIMELQPNTMYLDEDNITGALGAPIKHMSDNTFHVLCYYLAATQEGAAETWQQEIEGMRDDYIRKCLTQWEAKFAERKMPFHPELKKELEKLLPSVWLAAITRAAGHVKDNYSYIRAWDQVFYGTPKEKQRPDMNTVLPDGSEGEATFREAAEKVTRTLRLMARPSTEKDQTYNINTSRITESIGFSGSNHILAIVEVRDLEVRATPSPVRMLLHWGTIPQDFFSQWNTKFGSKYEVVDARKGQPKAKGVAASAEDEDQQVFYHGTSWEAAQAIDKEGLKANDSKFTAGKKYIWCAIAEFAAKEYGASITDSDRYAVVEFVWDYSRSEPDPEHFEEGDMYRRIEGDVPRQNITAIYYYDGGRKVKTAAVADEIKISTNPDGRIIAKHPQGVAMGTLEDRAGLANWFDWNTLPKGDTGKYDKAFVLGHISVRVDARRTGLGRALVGALLDAARAQGAEVCFLTAFSLVGLSAKELDAFYTNVGFQPYLKDVYVRKLAGVAKFAAMNTISMQDAQDRKLFGPVYHGTTEERQEQIGNEGFKVYIGDAGSGDVAHGYEGNQPYHDGIPAPVHHLGYGIYFTTSKTIAKQFAGGTTRGMKTYYLDVPNYETINFGVPKTMMKWWISQGYDPQLAKTNRVEATKKLTENLKSKYDAVWFKGKGLHKLLDGDQICVFDPSRVYQVDPNLAKPGDVGSKVKRLADGMKGTIVSARSIPEDVAKQYWGGETRIYSVKWTKGGTDNNVKGSQIEFLGAPKAQGATASKVAAFYCVACDGGDCIEHESLTAAVKSNINKLTFEPEENNDEYGGWTINAWTPDRMPRPYAQYEGPVGFINIGIEGASIEGPYVYDINVEDDWRGTGLGQQLYDLAVAEAKKRGYTEFNSSTDQTPEAKAAWKRLSQRYQVTRKRDKTENLPYFSLKLAAVADDVEIKVTPKQKGLEAEVWLGDQKVGFAYFHLMEDAPGNPTCPPNSLMVDAAAVSGSVQRQGVGLKMYRTLIEASGKAGYDRLYEGIDHSEEAIGLWEKLKTIYPTEFDEDWGVYYIPLRRSKTAAEGFNDEGFWAGEGNAASGVLPICTTTQRVCLAWRSPDVHIGDCWGVVGGAVKKGMTPQESAKEELGEETGYRGGITLHPAFVFHAD